VYVERMRREYKVDVETSPPRVAYRETITTKTRFDYAHKKQTGGSGQYGRVAGYIEPHDGPGYEFVDDISQGRIPREFIPSCDKGFRSMQDKGMMIGAKVVGVRCVIDDGAYHAVDSSDIAFQEAARGAWRSCYMQANPIVLEPLMKVEVEGPSEFLGAIVGTLLQRRGIIIGSQEEESYCRVEAEVPLSEMFGYSNTVRTQTQGKAEFSMEFSRYERAPNSIVEELLKIREAEKKAQR
jgi:elongation factor G